MIDRQKLETVLGRRFPTAKVDQIAAAANAIMGLEDEWEEVGARDDFGYLTNPGRLDTSALAPEPTAGIEFRVLRRRVQEPLAAIVTASRRTSAAPR